MTDRYHAARVYIAQARYFRKLHRAFSFTLLDWAANARRRAQIRIVPVQLSLFEVSA